MSAPPSFDPASVNRISRRTGICLIIGNITLFTLVQAVAFATGPTELIGWATGSAVGLAIVGALLVVEFANWYFLAVGLASAIAAITAAAMTSSATGDRPVMAMIAAAVTMTIGLCLDSILLSLKSVSEAEARQWRINDEEVRRSRMQLIRADEALGVSRELHNRVANTLHAVAQRREASSPRMRERCRTDLQHLIELRDRRHLTGEPGTVNDLACDAREHALRIGVDLEVTGPLPDVPAPHYAEVQAAIIEAITNVSKHSRSSSAQLIFDVSQESIAVRVCDRGGGWSADRAPGTGTTAAMGAPTNNGPTVSISNLLDGGLAVDVEVSRLAKTRREDELTSIAELAVDAESTVPVARSLAFWLLGFCGVFVVVLWDYFPPWWWLVMTLLGTCMPMALINYSAAKQPPSSGKAALIATSIAVLVAMPIASHSDGVATLQPTAIVLAGCVPAATTLLVVAWLMPTLDWVLAMAGFVVGLVAIGIGLGEETTGVTLASAAALVLAAALSFGLRTLRHQTTEHDRSMLAALRETSRTIATAEAQRNRLRIRNGILQAIDSDIEVVLSELANGTLDPTQQLAAARIEQQETDLRTVIAVAAHPGVLGERLVPRLRQCRIKGCVFAVRGLTPDIAPTDEVIAALEADIDRAISTSTPGSLINLSCYSTAQSSGFFLQITGVSALIVAPDPAAPWRSTSIDSDTALVEYRW